MWKEMLSIVSICRNEEDLIDRYFHSIIQGFGDDIPIVIVDTGSTDGTIAKIKKYQEKHPITLIEAGDRFVTILDRNQANEINRKLKYTGVKRGDRYFSFKNARNFADENVKTPWAFSLDICDVIELCDRQKLHDFLDEKLTKNPNVHACISTLRFGNLLEPNPVIQTTTKIYRVGKYDNGNFLTRWHCGVHEYLCNDGRPVKERDGKIRSDRIPSDIIIHRHAQREVRKGHSYLVGMSCALYLDNIDTPFDRDRMTYYLARELFYITNSMKKTDENYEKARGASMFLLEKTTNLKIGWAMERSSAANMRGILADKVEEKRKWFLESIRICPSWRQPYLSLAMLARGENDYSAAIGYLKQAMDIKRQPSMVFAEPESNYTITPYKLCYEYLIDFARLWITANNAQELSREPVHLVNEILDMEDEYIELLNDDYKFIAWCLIYRVYWHIDIDTAQKYVTKCYLMNPEKVQSDFDIISKRVQKITT